MRITFEVNGRPVDPDDFGDAFTAAALKSVEQAIAAKVGSVRCPVHGGTPSVVAHGRSLGALSFTVSGCCPQVVDRVKAALGAVDEEPPAMQPASNENNPMTPGLVLPGSHVFLTEGLRCARGGNGEPRESLADFHRRIQGLAGAQRITGHAARLLTLTVHRANADVGGHPEADEAISELAMDAGAYRVAVQELEARGFVRAHGNMNHPSGYGRAIATPSTLVQVVGQVLPDVDVRRELGRLLSAFPKGTDEMISSEPFLALGIPAPRVQFLMEFLRDQGLVRIWEGDGRPLWFFRAQLLVKGRLMLQGE